MRRGIARPSSVDLVVVEAVVLVPQARAAERVHRVGDGDEVLEELRGDVLVGGVLGLASSSAMAEHRRAVEGHPGGAVGLLEVPPSAAACERSKTPMLSRPRKPPLKRCLPSGPCG
jgi:hypothetical protein